MIEKRMTTAFDISRQSWTGSTSNLTLIGSAKGHIQQASLELAQQLSIVFTKAFTIWFPLDTDVKEGDTLNDGTNDYSVRAIQENAVGCNTHLELTVQKDDV